MNNNHNEFGKDLFEEMSSSILPIVSDSEKKKKEIVGSATLLNIDEKQYIVTAAHVVKNFNHTGLYLLTENESINISCSFCLNEQLDIGFSILNKELSIFLDKTNKNSLSIIDDNPDGYDEKFLYAFGYPSSKCYYDSISKSFKISPMQYFGSEVTEGIKFDKSKSLIDKHLLINFDKGKSKNPVNKEMTTAPNPYGLSGGGLFEIYIYRKYQYKLLFLLKGILIEWRKDLKLMKALKADILKEILLTSSNSQNEEV